MTFETSTRAVPVAIGATARPTVLTDRGHAVCAAYRLLAALRELGPDDRRDVLELLELELAETVA
jgi:hypothetical protein